MRRWNVCLLVYGRVCMWERDEIKRAIVAAWHYTRGFHLIMTQLCPVYCVIFLRELYANIYRQRDIFSPPHLSCRCFANLKYTWRRWNHLISKKLRTWAGSQHEWTLLFWVDMLFRLPLELMRPIRHCWGITPDEEFANRDYEVHICLSEYSMISGSFLFLNINWHSTTTQWTH